MIGQFGIADLGPDKYAYLDVAPDSPDSPDVQRKSSDLSLDKRSNDE
jgi:hypothetical protein